MNIENLRSTKFGWLSKWIGILFGNQRIKKWAELAYWTYKRIEEGKLSNGHYEYFATSHFGISKEFYTDKRILDIGCGPRGSLEWADKAKERYGLDPLAENYQQLSKGHAMTYITGVAEDIPFHDHYFDIILSFNSLDHVDDLSESISEIFRVLKPEGLFLLIADIHQSPTITEPSAFSWGIMKQLGENFEIITEKQFEGHRLYKSIREGIPYDHSNSKDRYGVLTACLKKPK